MSMLCCSPALAQDAEGSLNLSAVLRNVYESNPALLAAREELKETQELYPQARAGWLPSVNAEGSVYTTHVKNSNFGGADGATTKDVTLSIDQPLWRGGRTSAEIDRANSFIRAGEALLIQEEQALFLQAIDAYLAVLRNKDLLDLRRENEALLSQEFQATSERLEIGDITDTDLQQAKTRLSRAKSARLQAEADLSISKAEFEDVTGIYPAQNLVAPYIEHNLPQDVGALSALAERQNPAMIIASYEREAAEYNADAVFRELLPQISAFASVNRQYDPQPGIVDKSETETIGLRATVAFYQGGAIRSRGREARYAAKRRDYELLDIGNRVRREVISSWESYQASKAQTESRKDEIEAAQLALRGVREEARIGQRSVLDILDADQEMIEARISLVRAKYAENLALFTLLGNLGLLNMGVLSAENTPMEIGLQSP